LTSDGAKKFSDATLKYIGQVININLDGVKHISPSKFAHSERKRIIEGEFTEESAQNLAMQIESGALPLI
jgi:preprotein translocase subunit SecD